MRNWIVNGVTNTTRVVMDALVTILVLATIRLRCSCAVRHCDLQLAGVDERILLSDTRTGRRLRLFDLFLVAIFDVVMQRTGGGRDVVCGEVFVIDVLAAYVAVRGRVSKRILGDSAVLKTPKGHGVCLRNDLPLRVPAVAGHLVAAVVLDEFVFASAVVCVSEVICHSSVQQARYAKKLTCTSL